MFKSVLIANRGEIACRIARTAKRLGIRTVAVYSDADRDAPHVRQCDEALLIGPAPAAESYLSAEKLIAAALRACADCLHPGYGFLSENAEFAEGCAAAGIAFVGPPPDAIRAMGLKHRAKALAEKAGVPIVPGYHGDMQDTKFLKQKAYELGYPVLIKALAGGGGKGMRRVDRHADFDHALEAAQREAKASFGDPRVLIEKFIANPRHIEIQIFADHYGNIIHLAERDCSLQRRHQKVIEEAPAPGMTAEMRAAMGGAAVSAARAAGYVGAGTVEFVVESANGLSPRNFWFLEMNTRLQVEHPVTEAITGIDLVEWQFLIAAGGKLPLAQSQVKLDGHAVEARLYAEDPERGFLPSTGKIIALAFPDTPDLRVDAGVEAGSAITPYYDPMMAKLIARGPTRGQAIDRLATALAETMVIGPRSNLAFLAMLCRSQAFRASSFDTGFIDANLEELGAVPHGLDAAAAAFGTKTLLDKEQSRLTALNGEEEENSPWDAADAFQLSGTRRLALPVMADGEPVIAEVTYGPHGAAVFVNGTAAATDAVAATDGDIAYVLRAGRQTRINLRDIGADEAGEGDLGGLVRAPMHGKVLGLFVAKGTKVVRGQRVAIIEAMKMEHTLIAPIDGIVVDIAVGTDAQVAEGADIMRIGRPAGSDN
ncbi:MAG TPA: biotin carboxylase N-terminal domain-containing protein [Pseudolabrys sp.]|nr:biotin carboxylase N-terminal domain-containing protein [Pseudolabrys sp.]